MVPPECGQCGREPFRPGEFYGGRGRYGPWLSEYGIKQSEVVLVDDCPVLSAKAIAMTVSLVEHPSRLADVVVQFEVARPFRKGPDVR
jgi:hypothetical protein